MLLPQPRLLARCWILLQVRLWLQLISVSLLDTRERHYDQEGLGSSYLFRVDMEWAVDATKKVGSRRPALRRPWPVCQK